MIKLIMLGVLDNNGYELDNRVYFRGGICPCISTITAQKMCVKKYERDNNKGAIGNTKIQNNDSGRVFSRVGISGTIKGVSYKDPPKVLRKWKIKE